MMRLRSSRDDVNALLGVKRRALLLVVVVEDLH